MKIRSYKILFRFFSFLSDKTNGAPLFVKYKLLLGTLIISIAGSSANAMSKIKGVNDTIIPIKPEIGEVTCYKPAIHVPVNKLPDVPDKTEVKGRVVDERGESVIGGSVVIKKDQRTGTITDLDGKFSIEAKTDDILVFSYIGLETKEVPVSVFINSDKPVVMMDGQTILCYDVVIIRTYPDPIYTRSPKRITKLSYSEAGKPPVSPVGNLSDFQLWMNENIQYNQRMLENRTEGIVILSFDIDKKGKVVNKKVTRKLSPDADAEALRLLSYYALWTPGEHQGKRIKTTMTVTVNFKMPENNTK